MLNAIKIFFPDMFLQNSEKNTQNCFWHQWQLQSTDDNIKASHYGNPQFTKHPVACSINVNPLSNTKPVFRYLFKFPFYYVNIVINYSQIDNYFILNLSKKRTSFHCSTSITSNEFSLISS